LNRRLVPAAAVLASLGLASTAVAAADSPATGKWKGSNDTDAASFKVGKKSGSAFKASSVRVTTTASCEDPNDPSGPVSARRLKLKLPGGSLNSKGGSRKLTTVLTRKLSAGRTQTVTTTIKLTGDRTGKVTSQIKDDVTGKSPLRCRATVSLKVKPVS
jgi:carbohydrate-selective porin OprB